MIRKKPRKQSKLKGKPHTRIPIKVAENSFTSRARLLRKRRLELGMTLAELAERTGVTVVTLRNLECAVSESPRWEVIQELVRHLGISYADLETPRHATEA